MLHDFELGDVVTVHPTAHGHVPDDPTFWTQRDPDATRKTFLISGFPAPQWVEVSEMDGTLWEPSKTGIHHLWFVKNHFLTQARKAVADAQSR